MRQSRIYTDQALQPGDTVALDDRARRYISQALRLRIGAPLTVFNGDGRDLTASLEQCDRNQCLVSLGEVRATEGPPALRLELGIGISRGERMDMAIQKSVELGVHTIAPLNTERSMVQLKADRLAKRLEHWQGIIVSACEQSGRNRLPQLRVPGEINSWLADQEAGVLLYHRAEQTLAEMAAPSQSLSLLVGPEGGLSEQERRQALAANFSAIRLGPRVMRTETAPLAALAAIQALWGDFR